ncbi:MAG: transketolase C-terminal domain-containing protein [Myxococcota bacterium]|nr:transketolase C-terminal domain-containing protein [Myxococcota bacterium]
MTGASHIAAILAEAMGSSDAVHVVGEALPLSTAGSMLLSAHPERCHLLPAADPTLVGFAIGLALAGRTPVVELSGTESLWGAIQQLGQESLGLSNEFAATMVLRVPVHGGPSPALNVLEGLPSINVVCPAEPADAGALLRAALASPGVTILLEPVDLLGASGGQPGDATLGKARCVVAGEHVTIAAWGPGVEAAHSAAKALDKEGISAEILDLRSIAPLDVTSLSESVNKTGRLVLVDAGPSILNQAVEAAFLRLESPPTTVAATPELITSKARAAVHY